MHKVLEEKVDLALETLREKKILVTGASGFIGSHICERLVGVGDVVGFVRNPVKSDWLKSLGVKLIEGDLTDHASVKRAVQGCDYIFSVAGWLGVDIESAEAKKVNEVGIKLLSYFQPYQFIYVKFQTKHT